MKQNEAKHGSPEAGGGSADIDAVPVAHGNRGLGESGPRLVPEIMSTIILVGRLTEKDTLSLT